MKKLFVICFTVLICGICHAQMQYTFPLKTTTFPLHEDTNIEALLQNLQSYFEGQPSCHITLALGKSNKIRGRLSSTVFYKSGWLWILFNAGIESNKLVVKYEVGSKKKELSQLFSRIKYSDKLEEIELIVKNMNEEINEIVQNY